jgi:hypothetical protein
VPECTPRCRPEAFNLIAVVPPNVWLERDELTNLDGADNVWP